MRMQQAGHALTPTPISIGQLSGTSAPSVLHFMEGLETMSDYDPSPPAQHSITEPHATSSIQDLSMPALAPVQWALLRAFLGDLDQIHRNHCLRCGEQWFRMPTNQIGICGRCMRRDKHHNIGLMSAENEMLPTPLPAVLADLPLTQVEEMLIALVQVTMQVRRVRGHQFGYRGHVAHFMQSNVSAISKLPWLPGELNVIILKPPTLLDQEAQVFQLEFSRDFKVRRNVVAQWLVHLKRSHPDYANIPIDHDRLSRLPDDDAVTTEFVTVSGSSETQDSCTSDNLALQQIITTGDAPEPEVVMVPDTRDAHNQTELETIQQALGQAYLSMPLVQRTPITEWDGSSFLLRKTFPSLYFDGKADLHCPRARLVQPKAYFEHLLRLKDNRFGSHPRFRYVAFNMLMRASAGRLCQYFCRQHPNEAAMDAEALIEALQVEGSHLAERIARRGSNLRGTRPFWQKAAREVEAFTYDLGPPSLFVTFSAADLQWSDLARHYPIVQLNVSETARARLAWKNLQEHPHIAADYLTMRMETYMRTLKKVFNVEDYWYRYEWQARGSGHVHGFLWLEDAPILDTRSSTTHNEWLQFYGAKITAINPDLGTIPPAINPCSRTSAQRCNTLQELSELLNSMQRHTRCPGPTCARKDRVTGQIICRFNFPKEHQQQPVLLRKPGGSLVTFEPSRNDSKLNAFNAFNTMAWQANTDITPCTDLNSVLHYIAKYCTKAEVSSTSYRELLAQVLAHASTTVPLLSAAHKLLNSLIVERDWSAQEVSHLLLDRQLIYRSRPIVFLDVRPLEDQTTSFSLENGEISVGEKLTTKYCHRSPDLEALTLLDAARHYIWVPSLQTFKKPARHGTKIVNVYPHYSSSPDHETFQDFCRAKMMLHHAFRDIEDLLDDPGLPGFRCSSWSRRLSICATINCQHQRDPLDSQITDIDQDPEEDDNIPLSVPLPGAPREDFLDWEHVAACGPGHALSLAPRSLDLGQRPIDRTHDWTLDLNEYRNYNLAQWLSNSKATWALPESHQNGPPDLATLTGEQSRVYRLVYEHYQTYADDIANAPQILLNLDGPAGTGKSYLIQVLSQGLLSCSSLHGFKQPVIRTAPTGVAAFGIQGRTIHSLFSLPIRGHFDPLNPERLGQLQQDLSGISYLIVDEKSMVSLALLYQIDQRLRQARPHRSSEVFSGMSILLCGDFAQLPPVAAKALYRPSHPGNSAEIIAGYTAYTKFDRSILLTQIMRQQEIDPDSAAFKVVLEELRLGPISSHSWRLLLTRCRQYLSPSEQSGFDSALHIFFTKDKRDAFNQKALERFNRPVICIQAVHQGRGAKNASSDDASGLHAQLFLCHGAQVMLTDNLWTDQGLVNGTVGYVHEIVWPLESDPVRDLPLALLMAVNNYHGPALHVLPNGNSVIPIIPVTRKWRANNTDLSRQQLPIILAHGITVHKSQGMTLDKAVISLPSKVDFAAGLSYVAISRVKQLAGLMFQNSFDQDRFGVNPSSSVIAWLADEERRRLEIM